MSKWKYFDHQIDISNKAYQILKSNGLVYLSLEERVGKSGIALRVCEMSVLQNFLVITKKKALDGWNEHIQNLDLKKNYTIINYHSLHKLGKDNFDLVIVDEAHAYLSKYPKPGTIWKDVAKLTKHKPIIYLSATPSAQGYSLLFHQFALSDWSPWRHYSNFYKWFNVYGVPRTRFIGGKQFKVYDDTKEDLVRKDIDHLFISYTRQELGFEHEPNDVIHFVELNESTKSRYKYLENDNYLLLEEGVEILAESPMSLMTKLHQIEGGTIKFEEQSYTLGNTEKISFIKEKFGDTEDMVIFYHYKQEEKLLKENFKKAIILQATSFAEGVDLSMYTHLIVYSMNFSTAQYTQRRARQANMKRDKAIDVHFILVKGGISEQVYTTVAVNKKNFVNSYYMRGLL